MYIFAADCVLSVDMCDVVYVPESNVLRLERAGTCYELKNVPDNALQLIAEGIAEGKRFIEFENAELIMEDNNDTSGSIE